MNEHYDDDENLGLSMDSEEEGVQDAEPVSDADGEGDDDAGSGDDHFGDDDYYDDDIAGGFDAFYDPGDAGDGADDWW